MSVPVGKAEAAGVEEFAQFAKRCAPERCTVLTLLPWSCGAAPSGILAPRPGGDCKAVYSGEEISKAMSDSDTVLIPCLFESEVEVATATALIKKLRQRADLLVLMVQLLPRLLQPSRETNAAIMRRQEQMFVCGASDVLLAPKQDADELRRTLQGLQDDWKLDRQRIEAQLTSDGVGSEVLSKLYKQHRYLLWESIPNSVMPSLKALDKNLVETREMVGSYTILSTMPTVAGSVIRVEDPKNTLRAMKIVNKELIEHPEELQNIYIEHQFLSRFLSHPNIVKMVDMLHSNCRIYFVLEYAGDQNLLQALRRISNQRMPELEALFVFDQVLSALAYCHTRNVSHLNVCMEHVAVDGERRCRLLDFRSAFVTKRSQPQHYDPPVGRLPCIAPQVALSQPYTPRFADAWSLGVLLLETAGGLNSVSLSVKYAPEARNVAQVAQRIAAFFQGQGSHAAALTVRGAPRDADVLEILEKLLVVDEGQRLELRELYRSRQPEPAAVAQSP